MGQAPSPSSSGNAPSRPMLKWDITKVLGKDYKGSQEEYAEEVKEWYDFPSFSPIIILIS